MANYLYNGVEFPELPDYDKETHPYALIVETDYYLLIIGQRVQYVTANSDYTISFSGDCRDYILNGTGDSWVRMPSNGMIIRNAVVQNIVWSNTDILNKDGSVLLTASDPVLVSGKSVTAHRSKGGAWQKQDIYKRVVGEWVKQPQSAFEAKDGAWAALS